MKPAKAMVVFLLLFAGWVWAGQDPGNSTQGAGDNQPEQIRFQELIDKWDRESAGLKARGKPERGQHDKSLLIQFLQRFPKGEYSERVYLLLLEDGFCQTWANYPDCGAIEIAGYEQFLENFPDTRLREEIELKMARDYHQMAWLWLKGDGEHSDKWSELFRGQSLSMARKLQKSQNPQIKQSALELEQKLFNNFARPVAPVPPQVLRPDYY